MYIERLLEKKIERKLKTIGAISIEGPKFCGKTTTSMKFAKSYIKIDENYSENQIYKLNSEAITNGESPRLVDE
jgi:predicted AAA+ superfamily ATPase